MRSAHTTEVTVSALEPRPNNTANDLFPDTLPPVTPALWPTRGTRADEALQALLQGPQNQADYWIGWRLAAYVQSLEDDGWHFITRDIIKPGCRRPIKEYRLDRADPGTSAALIARGAA
ncbi:MAG: hypothetical protein D3M94_07940 [Rhodocyclales bacterium GT-UBC]|nr:MAG: hypothetical protein D3M94_07940 [Rhodocyclales bacterium GT-UBC]